MENMTTKLRRNEEQDDAKCRFRFCPLSDAIVPVLVVCESIYRQIWHQNGKIKQTHCEKENRLVTF